jgi:hypothetical protein
MTAILVVVTTLISVFSAALAGNLNIAGDMMVIGRTVS